MNFQSGFARSYSDAWAFLRALPFLGLAIIGFEGLQHTVEYGAGMFASVGGMHTAANDPGRMLTGVLKIGWLFILQYWVVRFVVSRSRTQTLARDPLALRKFAPVLAISIAMSLSFLFLPEWLASSTLGRSGTIAVTAILGLASLLGGVFLVPWTVSAALGDERASPMFAIRRARGSILWALAFGLATPLPLMALHYALNYAAAGRAFWLTVVLLAIDAVITGFLGVVASTSQVMIAERMAERAGDRLVCSPTERRIAILPSEIGQPNPSP